MSDRTTIAISKETLKELYSTKFEFKVNTMESVIKGLLQEHHDKQEFLQ